MDLYDASNGGHHAPGVKDIPVNPVPEAGSMDTTAAPETMKLVDDEQENVHCSGSLGAQRGRIRTRYGPFRCTGVGIMPPVPQRSTCSQTLGCGSGRGRGHYFLGSVQTVIFQSKVE